MDGTPEIGRVINIGKGWVEVDLGGAIRRVMLPPGLLVRVGNYLELRGDSALALTHLPSKKTTEPTTQTHKPTNRYQQ